MLRLSIYCFREFKRDSAQIKWHRTQTYSTKVHKFCKGRMSAETQSKPLNEPEKEKVIQSLEEDDEFEDFEPEDWTDAQAVGIEGERALWVEDWDDNDVDDNFTRELREELAKASKK